MATLVLRNTKGSALTFTEFDANFTNINDDVVTANSVAAAAQTTANSVLIHPYYFFHGYAGNQAAGDSLFFDLAAGNHGWRGTQLSDSDMFANAGFVSTLAPDAAPTPDITDGCIRFPNLNYDYSSGEKLFIFWRGIAATPASETAIMGDGTATSTGNHGIQVRVTTAGLVYFVLYGADAKVSRSTANTVCDGTTHDFALMIDGQNGKYAQWIDGAIDSTFAGTYIPFNPGFSFDTKNSNTFNLGAAAKAPGTVTLPQGGMATKTRTFVVIRMPYDYPVPAIANVTAAVQSLRACPGKLLLAGAL
jgi:hypothetical protein